MTISTTSATVIRIRKLPIRMTIFWKWLRSSSEACATSATTVWKLVCAPVLTTTASISPCLTIGVGVGDRSAFLLTGSDSPVSADWSISR